VSTLKKQILRKVGLLALAVLTLAGCGPRSDRLAVSGTVNLDGAPLDSGSILFTSVGGEKLVSAGAMIQDGAYQIPQAKGLLAGTYHVELNSPDHSATPAMDKGSADGRGIPVVPDRIPAEYNLNSTQKVEVTPDGDNEFNFDIANKPAK
jgi:hypothetical protein